jgi:pimeloyl-ACP methyl ester carboxylesterase
LIRLYQRLTKHCQTVNQFNRVHIALDNWLTPLKEELLRQQLLAVAGSEAPSPGREWINILHMLYLKSGKARPEPFRRRRINRHLTCYSVDDAHREEKTLLICFTGAAQRMMMPLPVFLQHLDGQAVDVAMLHYPRGKGFREGLEGMGCDFVSTIERLGDLLPFGQYRRVVAMGVSGGGMPAILTALKHSFDAVLAVGTCHPDDARWHETLQRPVGELVTDLAAGKSRLPEIFLVYGADMPADRAAADALTAQIPARHMAIALPDAKVGHLALVPLMMGGKIRSLLEGTILPG